MPLTNLEKVKELTIAPGIRARVINTDSVSVAHVVLDEGALLPLHTHPNEQIVNVIDGELELIVDGETHLLTLGRVVVLPPMVPHSGRATTKCYVIDVFHPVREDFPRYGGRYARSEPYVKGTISPSALVRVPCCSRWVETVKRSAGFHPCRKEAAGSEACRSGCRRR